MWNRGGFRSAALERAKAQLSGQRVTNSGTPKTNTLRDANFGKDVLQARQTPLQGLSDLSSEDAESGDQGHPADPAKVAPHFAEPFGMGGGSRFLKKSASSAAADGHLSAPSRTPADATDLKLIPQRSSQSVALSRLALIEDRLRNHKSKKRGPEVPLPQEPGLSVQSSSSLSMAGSHFLKMKVTTPTDQKDCDTAHVGSYNKAPPHVASTVEKGVDSDEEDMRRLLGESLDSPDGSLTKVLRQSPQVSAKTYLKSGVNVSSPSVPSADQRQGKSHVSSAFTAHHHQSVSPSPPLSPKVLPASRSGSRRAVVTPLSLNSSSSHSEIRSLEELFPVASKDDDTLSEQSAVSDVVRTPMDPQRADFKLNIMTLDDLAPVTLGTAELSKEKVDSFLKTTGESPSGFRELSVSSAHKISHEDRREPEEAPAEYESDFESEIQTDTAPSANEISEHFSAGDKHSSIATEPQSRSGDWHSDDDLTLTEDPSKSTSTRYRRPGSLSRSRSSRSSSNSSDATVTQSEPRRLSARRPVKDATVQTQRDGLTYTWSAGQAVLGPSVGMSYTDPTPVASHTISAEAVEALSAYSPAVFALNDMMRQQLALTRSFIETSRHLHQAMVESLGPADYRYTTLKETKEFIRCNRSPKLTLKDALEEVLQEMREYHYI
ncbi:uncharacterized protein C19orf44 homolog isoform X2 [Pygocentrus nattereri]|uniref:uncharacterized protein C19orf44 homolog isoform X2 n=1 Tax=Pygocentrus nattereri TaxID=42514 RepID=UPI0008147518|nr:uncharacterized protein C19orf44 homolog isoform X2 [Pygocentrus nattereri]